MENILVIGSGAREHAIAAALARSSHSPNVSCFGSTRNPGIVSLCAMESAYAVGSLTDARAIVAFALKQQATLAFIGPEAPLAAGVADALLAAGVPVVGPTQTLARIESSKGFARDLLAKYGIAGNPWFERFTSLDGVEDALRLWDGRHVIKDDGLAGGKGVKVCGDHLHSMEESLSFCRELVELGHPFVIEEKLEGEEFSLMSFCDGVTVKQMPPVQDHKRAFDGDTGPNTGGMGSYTATDGSLPFLQASDVSAAQAMNERVAAALRNECGEPYRGILYGGFMATADGVRLVEYNARFGDPECLNLLSLLETDFVDVCRAIVEGKLAELNVRFTAKASVCKYVVPEGYPDAARKGEPVSLPPAQKGVAVYLGSVDECDGVLTTAGSRTLGVIATADALEQAERRCSEVVRSMQGRFFWRNDIGTEAAIARRVAHMKHVRGESMSLRVGVLGSTRGTALQGVLDAIASGTLDAEVALVVADKPSALILDRAARHGVSTLVIEGKGRAREAFDAEVSEALREANVDVVLMIGYMRIVSAAFVDAWRGRLLNVHPSLLPAFGGKMNRSVHEAVLDAGVAETGCTIHQVTEEVDGGPVVLQRRCAVLPDDTVETLKDRVQVLEQEAFVTVLREWRR